MTPSEPVHILPSPGIDRALVAEAAARAGSEWRIVDDPSGCDPGEDLVLRVAPGSDPAAEVQRTRALEAREGFRYVGVILLGADPAVLEPALLREASVVDAADGAGGEASLALALARARQALLARREIDRLTARVHLQGREMQELNRIGIALSAERDPDALLEMILRKMREITGADAGSLYLLEPRPGAEETEGISGKQMRFRLTQNDSRQVPFSQFVMPLDSRSIAGYVALSGRAQNLDDAYQLPPGAPFTMNRSFDESTGYLTRSMLVVPMRNHRDEVIGVVQLINRKRQFEACLDDHADVERLVVPFDAKCQDLAQSLASQAAVALENSRLLEEIKRLFEGFIRASVTAIESRDPTTSGHSARVADLTVGLADAVNRTEGGALGAFRFNHTEIQEIRFASLLHDFGKIGVREPVLVKEKKLYGHELERIRSRFLLIRRGIELQFVRRHLQEFGSADPETVRARLPELERELQETLARLERYLEVVVRANEPTVLEEGGFEALHEIGASMYEDPEQGGVAYLTQDEVARLSIGKGSLSAEEREEIESHVTHTFNFLAQIPWSRDLRAVPRIAFAHHEKLNGTGYPRQLTAPQIPIQSRMMTVSDIYDALTASDRPYKRAVPTHRALDILADEVKHGKLDPDLFRLFLEAKVYENVPLIGARKG